MPAYRVVHVHTGHSPRDSAGQLRLLHRGLLAAGVDSLVLCRAGGHLARQLATDRLPLVAPDGGPLAIPRAIRTLRGHAAAGAIIHAHTPSALLLARLAVTGSRAPLVATARLGGAPRRGPLARWCQGPRTTCFIAGSQAAARALAAAGIAAGRIAVIRDGVAPPLADALPARLDEPAGRLIVLCAAALAKDAGHRVLLDAWRRVEAAELPATLLLAGAGNRQSALRRQAAGLTQVRFLGWRDDLPRLLAASDLLVLPTPEEGPDAVLIEAQLAGVPVVATTAGGIPEAVADGVSGLLVAPGDAAALADALRRVLDDHALRARLAGGARMNGRNFPIGAMVEGHRALYAGLATTPSTPPPAR